MACPNHARSDDDTRSGSRLVSALASPGWVSGNDHPSSAPYLRANSAGEPLTARRCPGSAQVRAALVIVTAPVAESFLLLTYLRPPGLHARWSLLSYREQH